MHGHATITHSSISCSQIANHCTRISLHVCYQAGAKEVMINVYLSLQLDDGTIYRSQSRT